MDYAPVGWIAWMWRVIRCATPRRAWWRRNTKLRRGALATLYHIDYADSSFSFLVTKGSLYAFKIPIRASKFSSDMG